jgi:chemotaxis protein methyltransferase WspC
MLPVTIEALLSKKIGLDATTIGSSKIARAVEIRRLACGEPDLQAYLKRLKTFPQELEELIESVIVPETWFFRDHKPFEFLGSYVRSEWLPNHKNSTLRVLSLPCCTGEEPYSIAITLLEAGLNPNQFYIDAIDISKYSLNKAEKAVYSKKSFRGQELSQKQYYFQQTTEGYQVSELVRKRVNFSQGNLLELFTKEQNKYEVIFCRNLLIYFEDRARSSSLKTLELLLTPKGLLFVGSAETGMLANNTTKLVSVRQPFTFAYQKLESLEKPDNSKVAHMRLISNKMTKVQQSQSTSLSSGDFQFNNTWTQQVKQKLSNYPSAITPNVSQGKKQKSQDFVNLETARKLANQGKLEEAASLCKTYLSQNSLSAEVYVLLGEIYQGLGNEVEAEKNLQKAIYLDPNHSDALLHLALLKEHQGEFSSAKLIRKRLQRLQ